MLARTAMEKIVIGGAGMTGALAASLLGPNGSQLIILDKGRGTGGRMSTSRNPQNESSTVDLGAQYISQLPEDAKAHSSIYNDLIAANVLKPLNGIIEGESQRHSGTKHFVPPKGVGSVVKHFIKKSGAEIRCNHQVTDIGLENNKWKVTTQKGETELCDVLILTFPTPQLLQLNGDIKSILESKPDIKSKLENVSYSSRFAMGLYYEPGTEIDVPWSGKYLERDPCIRFVAIDSKKREAGSDVGPSLAVHTSVPFGIKHLEEDKDSVCTNHVLPRLQEILPQLPKPAQVKNHKWRYSQVHKYYEGIPGAVVLHENPLLVIGGDAFSRSRFDGCVDSALQIERIVNSRKQQSQM